MNKETITTYVNLLNQYEQNHNMQFTQEQLNLINNVNNQANNEIAELVDKIKIIKNPNERILLLNNYYNNLQNNDNILNKEPIDLSTLPLSEQKQVQMYYEYPELLEHLLPEEKKKYEEYLEEYTKTQEQGEKNIDNSKIYVKQKKQVQNNSGYIDVLFLSMMIGFIGGALTSVIMIILK